MPITNLGGGGGGGGEKNWSKHLVKTRIFRVFKIVLILLYKDSLLEIYVQPNVVNAAD